ncbi:hypothetical protein HanXRQr2_Chr02g0078531 [Helianthus annuus]|uniref:Uncharacterized protein n=1 Tax=Helianthus annuus TaxID=4232 RepID=A0A9K3JPS1_HELAN|nr:hypothetical protein HanXRQr2_Chr02g0078531 [Helianthus annuus]
MLSGHLQLRRPPVHKRARPVHLILNIIQLFTLALNQHCHIHKHLMQLLQVPLNFNYCIMPFLYLQYRIHHLSPPLLLDCLLQKRLTFTTRNQRIDCFLIRILSGYSVVSSSNRFAILRRHFVA